MQPEQAAAAAVANLAWLEDCAARLICVLALDRFGDYVSDQVLRLLSNFGNMLDMNEGTLRGFRVMATCHKGLMGACRDSKPIGMDPGHQDM